MGAWGSGPFDNDGAADWCGQLHDTDAADRTGLIRETLVQAVDEEDYLELDVAEEAIAAAAVIASQRAGGPGTDSAYAPEFLRDGGSLDLPADIAALAVRALDRIVAEDSEWAEEWAESGEAIAVIEELRALLSD